MRVSILTKLLSGFGVVVTLLLAIGLVGVGGIHSDHAHLNQLVKKVVPSTRAVGEISALMNEYRKDQLDYVVAEPADRASVSDGISRHLAGDLSAMRQRLATI